eukprot:3064899-Prorocentrum_lima.AAC.1
MTSSLVGSEMCIRDRRLTRKAPTSSTTSSSRPASKTPLSNSSCRKKPVSYTHLTLPTICSV